MVWNKIAVFWLVLFVVHITKADDLKFMLSRYPRAAQAAINTENLLTELCQNHQLAFPPRQLFIRAFKEEKELELWASDGGKYQLLKTYPICMLPGKPGPKLKQGDKQVPEGIYIVDTLNPNSNFHLSFRINYPNEADLIRSKDEKDPGGDIYIHGDCVSVGCLPMGDEAIEEIFWLIARQQSLYPQNPVNVHVFPYRFNSDSDLNENHKWYALWKQLKDIYLYFNERKWLPEILVNENGEYIISR
jgi:murein L,D-transpeptidase YafK